MPIFSERSKVYPFTTENLAGYMKDLNLENKKVLSVTGSGDHILNSFYYGASSVIGFDINSLASLFAELKFNALRKLDFENFKKYFFVGGSNTMNFETYKIIREDVSDSCLSFFDNLYRDYGFRGEDLRRGKFFNKRFDFNDLRIRSNPYLFSRDNFEKTKLNIQDKNIHLINSNIRDLSSKLKDDFDVVLLSNLADYSQQIYPNSLHHFNLFCKETIFPIKKHLNKGGIICSGYVYDAREKENYKSPVDNPTLRRDILGSLGMDYREIVFDSIVPEKENASDLVVLLTKKNG